jgi:ribosomal protein L37E
MFYLESCEICERSGSVADEAVDKICKLCKFPTGERTVSRTVKVQVKKREEEKNTETE